MPQYLSPGVYVEEVASAARPIAGVGTSTAGFIGIVDDKVEMPPQLGKFKLNDDGKTLKRDDKEKPIPVPYTIAEESVPQLITSWDQFKNNFGDIQKGNAKLAQAVYGFFNNGGTRCWVIRVAGEGGSTESTGGPDKAKVSPGQTRSDLIAKKGTETKGTETKGTETKEAETKGAETKGAETKGAEEKGSTASQAASGGGWTDLKGLLEKFAAIDEIAIVAAPGATTKAQQEALLDHCENMKDRVAILDGAQTPTTASDPGSIRSSDSAARDSTYGALYYPWIKVLDPKTGDKVSQPPSGHIAGIYARVDATRGVHKAPANEVIRGALDLERRLSRADQDGLNPSGINAIRAFDGAIKVFGARTLGGNANTEFKYISTRRLFNFLRESIDHGTQWVVFEPNTPALWQSISRNVTAFLTGVWRSGALFGTTAQEAFYVKCDAETNPKEQRDLGMVVTEVGVSIVRPAEFVIFRISQWAGPGE